MPGRINVTPAADPTTQPSQFAAPLEQLPAGSGSQSSAQPPAESQVPFKGNTPATATDIPIGKATSSARP